MARHDEKTSAGRAKMLSGGDTGDKLAEYSTLLYAVTYTKRFVFGLSVRPSVRPLTPIPRNAISPYLVKGFE